MCGIAGLKGEFTSEQLSLLESSLKHRGPDASGRYVTSDNDMALIHTRLSIQDISSAGNQPMVSSCKNFVLSLKHFSLQLHESHLLAQSKLPFSSSV